jgi:hypothetical protein
MKIKFLFVLAFCFGYKLIAQSELPKDYPTLEKIVNKSYTNFPKEGRTSKSGGGYSVSKKLLKAAPPKVALVSFFTFDPGLTKSYSYSSESNTMVFTTTVTKKSGATHGSASAIVDAFYYGSIDKLVAKFKENGMDLLLPEQFLNTDEKKNFYMNYEVKHDKFNNWLKNMSSSDHDIAFGWPDGYKPIDVIYEPFANYTKSGMFSTMDYKRNVSDGEPLLFLDDENMQNSVGYELAKQLDVDAVLIVYFTIYCPKETRIVLQNANMIMLGRNPVQPGEGEKKPMFYRRGQFYCATRFQPDVIIFNSKKKDPTTQKLDATGFDNVVLGLATVMCDYFKEFGK